MTDQERDDVPMLLRNVELPRFPLRSTSMCIPVKDDEYEEETFVPHTGPLFIQPPTQTTLAIPFTSRNIPVGCLDLHRENMSASHMPSCRKKLEEIGGLTVICCMLHVICCIHGK